MASTTGTVPIPSSREADPHARRELPPIPVSHEKELRYLTTEEYPLWDSLVEMSPQGSVFCRSWWIRASDPEAGVLGYFEGGRLVAGIPMHFEKRLGVRLCCMPKPTLMWGTVMEPLIGKKATATSRQSEILTIFAERIAQERIFVQAFHPSIDNWLPFYWNGFRQMSRLTFVLTELQNPSQIWNEMKDSCRRNIRKAEKAGLSISVCGPEVVLAAIGKTFMRQGLKQPYAEHPFRTLWHAAKANNAGECFAVSDGRGRIHAAAFLVWDAKKAHYLVGGADPALRDSGAMSLLLWRMIRFSAAHSPVFDFSGSMIETIEHYFRTFGASPVAYHYISKFPRWMGACLALAGKG